MVSYGASTIRDLLKLLNGPFAAVVYCSRRRYASGREEQCADKICFSCDKLDDTPSLLDFALSVLAEVTCANDERDLRDTTLAEDFAVAEGEEIDDGCGV